MPTTMKLAGLALLASLLFACDSQTEQHKDVATAHSHNVAASADGTKIRYAVAGHGEPTLVFVHCWTCNHHFWDAQVEHFSKQHRVIWLDLAGHGESRDSQRQTYSMQAFGDDVAAVVEAAGAEQVVLVGHSMGGPVSLEAAKRLGDRVVGIVGVDTFYTPFVYPTDPEAIAAFAKPFEDDFAGASKQLVQGMFTANVDPAVKQRLVDAFPGAQPAVGVSALYEIFNWNAAEGDASRAQFADRLYNINAAPNGDEQPLHEHVVMVPGVGHFIPQAAPEAFNRTLESVLESVVTTH